MSYSLSRYGGFRITPELKYPIVWQESKTSQREIGARTNFFFLPKKYNRLGYYDMYKNSKKE